MKSSRSIAFALLAAVAVVGSAVSAAFYSAVEAVSSTVQRLKAWAFEVVGLSLDTAKPDAERTPLVQRVRHLAYRLRQAKRARPVVTPRWRMCPSA